MARPAYPNPFTRLALLAALLLAPVCFAQVSDGEGLTPLEGVVAISDDRALWDAVKDSRDVNDFKAYLNKFPYGLFAELASNRIRALALGTAQPPATQNAQAPQITPQSPFIRQSHNFAPGQIIKDCADCPEMVVIPAGSFEMGSNYEANQRPARSVNLPSFLVGRTEVTQGQWKTVMGTNPSSFGTCGDDCPVERVSWTDVQDFALRLSQKTGKKYRLPSEAEWEYAARAGSTAASWNFGDSRSQLGDHAWYAANSGNRTQRVAQKRPNAFGLYDMHGNVWEWVEDCWHDNYTGAPIDGSTWTTDCGGNSRVLRGGSWSDFLTFLGSAYRIRFTPDFRYHYYGFRLARTP